MQTHAYKLILVICAALNNVQVHAADLTGPQYDLRERVQFRLKKNSTELFVFEYCQLSQCTELNPEGFSTETLSEMPKKQGLPSGALGQLVMEAGLNRKENKSITFGVAADIKDSPEHMRAICDEPIIQERLNSAKVAKDFILEFNFTHCNKVGGPYGNANTSLKHDADQLKRKLLLAQ